MSRDLMTSPLIAGPSELRHKLQIRDLSGILVTQRMMTPS